MSGDHRINVLASAPRIPADHAGTEESVPQWWRVRCDCGLPTRWCDQPGEAWMLHYKHTLWVNGEAT